MDVSWDKVHNNAKSMSRKNYISWIYKLPYHISCAKCRDHMVWFLNAYPPENEKDLLYWSWLFHNDVNRILNKEQYSYESFIARYG